MSGAAGFIGSHLCERLVSEGHHVLGFDNLMTGATRNIEHLKASPGFEFREWDVCRPVELEGPIDGVLHLASLASPVDYLAHPIETLDVGSAGTRNLLEIARRHEARAFEALRDIVAGTKLFQRCLGIGLAFGGLVARRAGA